MGRHTRHGTVGQHLQRPYRLGCATTQLKISKIPTHLQVSDTDTKLRNTSNANAPLSTRAYHFVRQTLSF